MAVYSQLTFVHSQVTVVYSQLTFVHSQLTFVHSQLTFDKRPRTLSGKRTDSPMNKTEKIVQPPIKE